MARFTSVHSVPYRELGGAPGAHAAPGRPRKRDRQVAPLKAAKPQPPVAKPPTTKRLSSSGPAPTGYNDAYAHAQAPMAKKQRVGFPPSLPPPGLPHPSMMPPYQPPPTHYDSPVGDEMRRELHANRQLLSDALRRIDYLEMCRLLFPSRHHSSSSFFSYCLVLFIHVVSLLPFLTFLAGL